MAGTRALGLQREERHHGADRVRQHDADMLARLREGGEFPSEHHAAEDQRGNRSSVRRDAAGFVRNDIGDDRQAPCHTARAASSRAPNRLRVSRSGRNAALTMMSCIIRPSAARRERPFRRPVKRVRTGRQHRQAQAGEPAQRQFAPHPGGLVELQPIDAEPE